MSTFLSFLSFLIRYGSEDAVIGTDLGNRRRRSIAGVSNSFQVLVLIVSCLLTSSVNASDAAWKQLLRESQVHLAASQAALEKDYHLSSYERWDIDQDTGELVFKNPSGGAVVAKIQFVGSYSKTEQTWLWSWDNSSIDPRLSSQVLTVRRYGETHDVAVLKNAEWAAEEADGWDMAAVTNYLLKGKGVYRPPFGSVIAFVVLTEIKVVSKSDP